MIVNHTHKFIFVHVPKAAGTSVSELFSQYSRYNDLEVGGTELGEALQHAYKRRFGLTKHSTAAEIRDVVGADTWGGYTSFAFVRDPYARAQSTFHFMKRWHGNKEMKRLNFMDDLADFRAFVLSDVFSSQKAHRLLWPQARWLQGPDGELIVDEVGRLETIDTDLQRLLSGPLGLVSAEGAAQAAPKKNKSAATDAALIELLSSDPEVEQRIWDCWQDDFKVFGYPRFDRERALAALAELADAPPAGSDAPALAPAPARAGKVAKAEKPGAAGKAGKAAKAAKAPAAAGGNDKPALGQAEKKAAKAARQAAKAARGQ